MGVRPLLSLLKTLLNANINLCYLVNDHWPSTLVSSNWRRGEARGRNAEHYVTSSFATRGRHVASSNFKLKRTKLTIVEKHN